MGKKADKPRKTIAVSVDEKDVDLVIDFCKRTGQDLSGLVDSYIQGMARTIRVTGLDKKKDVTRGDLLRLALAGIKEAP